MKCTLHSKESIIKKRETSLKNWGTEHHTKSQKFHNLQQKRNEESFGEKYYFQTNEFKEQNEQYWEEKHGVKNPSQVPSIRRKAENTTEKRFGVKYAMQNVPGVLHVLQKTFCHGQVQVLDPSFILRYFVEDRDCLLNCPDRALIPGRSLDILVDPWQRYPLQSHPTASFHSTIRHFA